MICLFRIYFRCDTMAFKPIWIFVEGSTDKDFCQKVICPLLDGVFDYVKIIEYAQMPLETRRRFVNSIKKQGDYFYLTDLDILPCITAKKETVLDDFKGHLDNGIMVIVKMEIESWYAAGINNNTEKQLKMKPFRNTNSLTKEQFNRMIPAKFDSHIDFMQEILKGFSKETAIIKNESFGYLMAKITGLIDNMEVNK